jgi:Na+/H+ antiporter NhaD/arsenite permease-like protein
MEPSAFIAVLTFLVAYGILATEKINRTIVVGAGSLVLLLFGVLSFTEAISYVNWETVGLLLGMFIIVIVLSVRVSSRTLRLSSRGGSTTSRDSC